MEKERYDFAISLGYNCEIANSLISCNARNMSYPFDWNFTKMWKINELFANKFSNFFARDSLVEARYTGNPARDKDAGTTYVHDGKYIYLRNDNNYYNTQAAKYNRRIERLLNILDKDTKILFIRLCYEDVCDEHIEFTEILSKHYPNCDYKLLIINMKNERMTDVTITDKIEYVEMSNINRYIIGEFIREKYDIPFVDTCKKDYTE
jgi:hypothetical protein